MKVEAGSSHQPVLREAFLSAARPEPGQRWIDGTFGRGGHSRALLEAGAEVLALDCDSSAAPAAAALQAEMDPRFHWQRANFTEMSAVARNRGWTEVNGVLLDLGVSSPQLDTAERGFSFRQEGPLDMRMDQQQPRTAADLVNTETETFLSGIFYDYGDERESRRIARALVARRQERPFVTTTDLAEVVAHTIPRRWSRGIHPATQVFQALRIAVNREREVLVNVLPMATSLLAAGGVLAVISFHSGEDRLVKQFLRDHTDALGNNGPKGEVWFSRSQRLLPTEEEARTNPRSRSARLRMGWKIGGPSGDRS
jgi:16S rRNA (cytosine1402-N4)-methyltransferase